MDSLDDLRTLQLGPLWVLSALAGTYARFDPDELDAFWDTVVAVALRTPQPARELLISISADRTGLLLDFELDDRPVVSGLGPGAGRAGQAGAVDRPGLSASAWSTSRSGLGRARGPYGRRITPEDEQMILLIAALLDVDVGAGT